MDSWWSALTLTQQLFWAIAIAGSTSLLILLVATFAGIHQLDIGHADPGVDGDPTGLHVLSIRTATAFALGFGWSGVIAMSHGAGVGIAIVLGLLVGGGLMYGVWLLLRSVMRLSSSGSLDYTNAIGAIASVYLPIPARLGGNGQVEVLVQGRLAVVAATTHGDQLPTGTKVRVVKLADPTTLVVEPVT